MAWLVQACGSGLRCQGLGYERAEELGWGLEYPLGERLGRKGKGVWDGWQEKEESEMIPGC